jgi:hypothetical protein
LKEKNVTSAKCVIAITLLIFIIVEERTSILFAVVLDPLEAELSVDNTWLRSFVDAILDSIPGVRRTSSSLLGLIFAGRERFSPALLGRGNSDRDSEEELDELSMGIELL